MNHGIEIFDHEDRRKHRFWSTAPFDPLANAKKTGMPHHARVTRGVLFAQSAMPLGLHVGKIMERVPAAYLLWVYDQPWARTGKWETVRDYIERHLDEIRSRAGVENA